jgi:ribonuclease VapC
METASGLVIGAPTRFETGMVVSRCGDRGRPLVDRFVDDWEVRTVPFGEGHFYAALDAFARFGKGRHPARLNYGDCMAYATARVAGLPLLFVGEDFVRTDIESA